MYVNTQQLTSMFFHQKYQQSEVNKGIKTGKELTRSQYIISIEKFSCQAYKLEGVG